MATEVKSVQQVIAERKETVVVHQSCPDRPYLELEVPQDFHAARFIRFVADSRDQGWTSEGIAHSWSWFDTSVRRPYGRSNLRTITLFQNRLANPEFHVQSIDMVPDHPWGVNWKPWVTALRPGDVIEMTPRAMFPAWLNIVRGARIELHYDALSAHHLSSHGPSEFLFNDSLYQRSLNPQTREIRVLSIYPGRFDDPIICDIEYVQLGGQSDHALEFDALSYSWGDSQEYIDVQVKDSEEGEDSHPKTVKITRPAESAMRHLRQASHPLRIWIDIICINQTDFAERAQQVGLMATIFSRARTVHVWLGVHPGIEAALRIIRDIYNFNKHVCKGGIECSCPGSRHTAIAEIKQVADEHKDWVEHAALRAVFDVHYAKFTHEPREYAGGMISPHISKLMSHLFDSPWFRRVWVLQEVLRARESLVHCSMSTVTWQELTAVNAWLAQPSFLRSEPHVAPGQVTMPAIWTDLSEIQKQVKNDEENLSPTPSPEVMKTGVLDIYIASLEMKSKEARDKLFAILSFGRETSDIDKLPSEIRPDYDKPLELVFADFTRWWIVQNQSLSILSYVHSNRLRTWQRVVYDRGCNRTTPGPSWTIPMDGTQRWSQATLEAQFSFQASGSSKPDIDMLTSCRNSDSDRMLLNLFGHRVAVIEKIGYLGLEQNFAATGKQQIELVTVLKKIFDPAMVQEHWKPRRVGTYQHNSASNLFDHLNSHYRADEPTNVPVLTPFSVRSNHPHKQRHSVASEIPVGSCTDPFFFTTPNNMLGVCPWTAKTGDLIVLLLGGNVPYLLRPVEFDAAGQTVSETDHHAAYKQRFKLIGECFVMGIMNGELIRKLQGKGAQPEIFTLS